MISDLGRLKKMMLEKPWLYEETEHRVLHLAESAIEFIRDTAELCEHCNPTAKQWLKDYEG